MSKKIDILIVIPDLNLGGTEYQIFKLLKHITFFNQNIEILTILQKGKLATKFNKIGIKVNSLSSYNWSKHNKIFKSILLLLFAINYLKFIWINKPKIIHFYLPFAYWFGGMLSYFCPKTKMIMSRRSTNKYQKKYYFSKIIEKILHSKMNLLIANSEYVKKELLLEVNGNKNVLTLYNGVEIPDLKKFKSGKIKDRLKINNNDIIFCTIANFIPYKGHLNLIEAIHLSFKKTNRNFKLILVGQNRNNYKKVILKKIDQLNLNKKILFFEDLDDVNEILSISNLLISSSLEESMSNSILEAMSMQLPCLVTNVGGSPELITNNYNGFVVPPNDINALSDIIIKILNSKNSLNSMGINSRNKIIKQFNIKDKSKELVSIYNSLLNF